MNSTLWKIRCSLNPKAQAVNNAQRQLKPDPYFPDFFLNRGLWYLIHPWRDKNWNGTVVIEACHSINGNYIHGLYELTNDVELTEGIQYLIYFTWKNCKKARITFGFVMIHIFTKKIKECIYIIHNTFTAIIFVCIFLGLKVE